MVLTEDVEITAREAGLLASKATLAGDPVESATQLKRSKTRSSDRARRGGVVGRLATRRH
jgi:hypothetical protein